MTSADRQVLTTRAYGGQGPLAARVNIYRWQQDRVDLPGVAIAQLAGVRGRVVEVGCGSGTYTRRLRRERPDLYVLPTDLSAAMAGAVVSDVCQLPLRNAAAGAVLAMHMLYHIAHPEDAVLELRRILRPGGVALVSTNGAGDKKEVSRLWSATLRELAGTEPARFADLAERFNLDGDCIDVLRAHFEHVEVLAFDRVTLLPEVPLVIDFIDSLRALHEAELPASVTWQQFMSRAAERVRDEIAETGHFRLTNRVGMFICR